MKHFEALGKDGWFINVSRGDVVDQKQMITALNDEVFGGAVLDVTTPEPLPKGHPLWDAKNCYITSHDSWNTKASDDRGQENFLNNAQRFLDNEELISEVTHVEHAVTENKVLMI